MKRWTRPVLVIFLGVLAVSYLGMAPAQAAKTETVVYRGYTVSWSEPDASDLKAIRTPGRAERFPAEASDRSIQKAKERVADAATQKVGEDPTDSCNFVPDSFGIANFAPACLAHDACYSSPTDRLTSRRTAACGPQGGLQCVSGGFISADDLLHHRQHLLRRGETVRVDLLHRHR